MKRKILFLSFSLFIICKCLRASINKQIDTAYYKNDCFKKYQGIWIYKDDSVKLTLHLKLYTKRYSREINAFADYLLGGYRYEKNGIVMEDFLSSEFYILDTISVKPIDALLTKDGGKVFTYFDCTNNGAISIRFTRTNNNTNLYLLGQGSEKRNNVNELTISISYHHNYDFDEVSNQYWKNNLFPSTMTLKRSF